MGGECIELNGRRARAHDLRALALVNYGHFTSMQVRDGCVRGLDLHLERLRHATTELFGSALDVERTRAWMRQAVGATRAPLSLRVTVFSRALDRDRMALPAAADVLVSTAAARDAAPAPLRVKSVVHRREAPHIKHVGTFGLFHQRRLAQSLGYDDALFVDSDGAVSEGSIWNVGFFDGERIVWPDAPQLDGVSMQLLKAGLRARGVAQVERRVDLAGIASFRAAFFTNSSCFARPLAAIDAVVLAIDTPLPDLLAAAWASQPWQRI